MRFDVEPELRLFSCKMSDILRDRKFVCNLKNIVCLLAFGFEGGMMCIVNAKLCPISTA